MDHDVGPTSLAPQFDRRAEYMKNVGSHQMRKLIQKCLHDTPYARPNMATIVKTIHHIMRSQVSVKEYIAISSYKANMSYELDVTVGERFLAYRSSVDGVLKTQSVETHILGYIPLEVVTDTQLEGTENKVDLHKGRSALKLFLGHEGNVSSSSVAGLTSPMPSIEARKMDSEMSCHTRDCSGPFSPISPSIVLTPNSNNHKSLSASGSFDVEGHLLSSCSVRTPATERRTEDQSKPSKGLNVDENLEPLMGLKVYGTLSRLSKNPSNPAFTPPETPSHPQCLELGTGDSEVSFHVKGNTHPITSIIPTSDSCSEEHGKCSEMSLNMEEILQPLERSRVYSKAKKSQPLSEKSLDPTATQSEAHLSQSSPEVYVGKYDFSATDRDQLSFKKGDLMTVLSKEEKWWFAQLHATGERGKIPSNFIVEKDSLEAEEWFFGTLRRSDAEKLLMRDYNSIGSYLVRESQSNPGQYSLSLRGERKVSHYLIEKGEDGTWSLADGDRFKSIPELLTSYSQETGALCTRLQAPCLIEEPLSKKIEKAKKKCELKRCDVIFLHRVRQTRFGEVWEGQWKQTTAVNVVTIKSSSKSPQDMIFEAAQMKKLNHPYVVKLFGASTEEEPMYVVIELPKQGDLLTYLKTSGKVLEQRELIGMAVQIAGGMACLEEHNFTHQYLSAQNILLGENMICKVANFGLAQACYEEESIRWKAPEIIKRKQFTIKSDVWSFGIVLYEIITCGQLPYASMTANQVCDALQSGYRIPQPSWCPDKLYSLMLNCWGEVPGNRLGFNDQMFQLTKLTKYYL